MVWTTQLRCYKAVDWNWEVAPFITLTELGVMQIRLHYFSRTKDVGIAVRLTPGRGRLRFSVFEEERSFWRAANRDRRESVDCYGSCHARSRKRPVEDICTTRGCPGRIGSAVCKWVTVRHLYIAIRRVTFDVSLLGECRTSRQRCLVGFGLQGFRMLNILRNGLE